MYKSLIEELHSKIRLDKANGLARFFKSGPGEYGEGDKFLGITVPDIRCVVKKFSNQISLSETEQLLKSEFHEERLTALLILVEIYKKASQNDQRKIFDLYLKSISKYINNWDLVDLSAPKIVGKFLLDKDRDILYELAVSENLWERRVAILSTFEFLYNKESKDTYQISRILLKDKHDLIHKATGWMLREAGKRVNEKELLEFLDVRSKQMPRTMLRYAIERLSPELKAKYMAKG